MTTTNEPAEGTPAVYQVRLPLSAQTVTFVADLLRGHLKAIGSRWRKLPAAKIAVIVLAVLRHDQRLADSLANRAGGNDVSPGTVRRWVREVLRLPAARAPHLDRALTTIARQCGEVVLIDGTLIRTERRSGKDNRKHYSGKHNTHGGLLFPALTDVAGNLLWISAAQPGRASEITTARHHNFVHKLREAGLGALADLGFVGLDDDPDDPIVITGRKATCTSPLTTAQKQANQLISSERAPVEHAPVEHAFADLKNWRILTKLRMDAAHATMLLRALLVLTHSEITR